MSKVFRLYKEGATTYRGWDEKPAFPYNDTARQSIEDPDGAGAKNQITSIPSPFARIDLVKTAFWEVCSQARTDIKKLDSNTIFHKMVSDALDVGEIFFNLDKYRGKIEVITWDARAALAALRQDGSESHYFVADALEKYMQADQKTYNFGQMQNIYLLNYQNGPDVMNIIGATSPATLFFCGANDLGYIQDIYFANNDRPFDSEYQPLYKRDFNYIKAWWTLSVTMQGFSTLFPEIYDYLQLTFRAIPSQEAKSRLKTVSTASLIDFDAISVSVGGQANQVEVLGTPLLKMKPRNAVASEFGIDTRRNLAGNRPLVLPVEAGNKYATLLYSNGAWGKTYKAPYLDQQEVGSRSLPFDGTQYPYLTISDFLEDTLLMVPHALDGKNFWDGNLGGAEQCTFLLPVKPLYFKYFSTDSLQGRMGDGQPALEMECLAGGGVRVTLRVPITGNANVKYIEYQRRYYKERQAKVSATSNEGGMAETDFTGFVMPGKRFANEAEAMYTVACVSTFSKNYRLTFYATDAPVQDVQRDCRNQQRGVYDYKAETYTLAHHNFDYIRVTSGNGSSGILLPTLPTYNGRGGYEFAVDLGTSNTHIEYRGTDQHMPQPLCTESGDGLMCHFFTPSYIETSDGKRLRKDLKSENELIAKDFLPDTVGKQSDFAFPTRTALSYAESTEWDKDLRVYGLMNVSMTYNKRIRLAYNQTRANIKWGTDPDSQTAMRMYIRSLLRLIRDKVVALDGSLRTTSVTWCYPDSMSQRRLSQMRQAWNDAYREMFCTDGDTREILESVAPIQYYFSRYPNVSSLVNIDIGGGTTDIAFSEGGQVKYITSFRFAANALFEDSLSGINPRNGIIDSMKGSMRDLLEKNRLSELVSIFDSLDGHPADMASFLFSLKDNSATAELAKNKRDFVAVLQNEDRLKIVFVLFYAAILYHVAQIIRIKGLNLPRHIAFSGNGSRVLGVLSPDARLLAKYTKVIMETVTGMPYQHDLDILGLKQGDNPKEATCKGGLLPSGQGTAIPQKITMKDSAGTMVGDTDTYSALCAHEREKIVKSVKDFFHTVLTQIPKTYDMDNVFGIKADSLNTAREVCAKDLDIYLDRGIALAERETGDPKNKIDDTLPFYPIKGVMQALSEEINEQNSKR